MDRKETYTMLVSAAPGIHADNVAKGFWPENRNKGECMMLIVSELGECLEAHRKNRIARDLSDFADDVFIPWFESNVKDTVEDEMADIIIRFLDYCTGYNRLLPSTYHDYMRTESTKNFGDDLLRIVRWLTEFYYWEKGDWGRKDPDSILYGMVVLCDWYNIDIVTHVKWKLKYNKTRGQLHGKAY